LISCSYAHTVENYYYSVRKNVFEYDDIMDTQRQIVYTLRRRALLDDDESIRATMCEFSDRNMEDFVKGHIVASKPVTEWNLDKLSENVQIYCELLEGLVSEEKLLGSAGPGGPAGEAAVTALLRDAGREAFNKKCTAIEENGPGLSGMVQRQVLLMQLDNFWQQHLKNMDFLKTSVTLRAYGQKNPLTEYKLEGYQVFLKMMSRIRRNAVYNIFLFAPRKLKPMDKNRIKSLIPSREMRRRQLQQAMAAETPEQKEARGGDSPTARTVSLARLALNVRQLLEARADLKELALASFGELKDAFARAGLLTLGDQLRWANACTEFELLEDEMAEEVYIGLLGRSTPTQAASTGAGERLSAEEVKAAQEVFQNAMDNPAFLETIDQFTQSPEAFLSKLKASSGEEGWTAEDVAKLRAMYRASGVDIDEVLKQMGEALDDLPDAQKEVVEYMQKMLSQTTESDMPVKETQASEVKV